ncbi:Gti1/Pac2 family-domain-containing protein [Gautieria morchelliformis]|nr:Gti1/Pac2 family-domain-containing protein [Gautieria morchelliformis]
MSADANISAPVSDAQEEPVQAWTDPPWTGWIETTGDALLILEAARRGMIPRVTRRLVDSERRMITSGSVFVFDEDESGIKRWTDGFFWSPSRILGNFLLYRETDKKANLRGAQRSTAPTSTSPSILVNDGTHPTLLRNDSSTLSRPKNITSGDVDRARERSLFGSLTNSKKFKSQGMMKKASRIHFFLVAQHLISYYKVEDVEQGRLRTPSSLPELAALEISPEYLDKTHFRVPPRVEYDSDGVPRYRGEADEPESPTLGLGELPSVSSVEGSSAPAPAKSKRPQKRYEPYDEGSSKARRKRPAQAADESPSDVGQAQTQPTGSPLTSSSSPPTSPVQPGGYDHATFYSAYGSVPGPAGSYLPLPAGYYPHPGPSVPYTPYPPTGSDPHPAYPPQAAFYTQHIPPHVYPQSGPGQGLSMGMMPYYHQPFTGWRPSSGTVNTTKPDEVDQKPVAENDTQDAEDGIAP